MARTDPFNSVVAARTRAAAAMLADEKLLAAYERGGGLKEDLEEIVATGAQAELANQGQSAAEARGIAATVTIWRSFDAVKSEYSQIMGAVKAVASDLRREDAPADVIVAVEQIVENEVPVRVITGPAGKRRVRRSESQEAVRAEIQKDAAALAGLEGAHAALARRKVDLTRLKKLETEAGALTGQLGERAARKGAAKAATQAEREAVRAQKQIWGAVYRLLAAVAADEPAIQHLLAEAARK